MKKVFRIAPLAAAIAAGPALAQDTDQTIAQMQQQLNSMQQQLNSVKDERVRFNGFFSTGIAKANNDAAFAGITENTNVKDLSLLALQGTFDVTEKSQAVLQLVGRGEQDWDPVLEWAYLSHRPTNDLQLRAGKMRLPLFTYSDSLEVGYSQPWVRPPESVYGVVGVKSYVGADATYTLNLDGSALTTQAFSGFTDEKVGTLDVEFRNTAGVNLTWTDYVWTLRGIAATAEVTAGPAQEDRGNFYGLGFGYDNGTWQVISEMTRTEVDGAFPDQDSAYLSVARRFDTLTPYAVIGWIESQDDEERSGPLAPLSVLNTRRDEYSLGLRWDITPGVAIKGDVTHVTGFEDAAGGLDTTFVLSGEDDSTNVYTIKIDSAF